MRGEDEGVGEGEGEAVYVHGMSTRAVLTSCASRAASNCWPCEIANDSSKKHCTRISSSDVSPAWHDAHTSQSQPAAQLNVSRSPQLSPQTLHWMLGLRSSALRSLW